MSIPSVKLKANDGLIVFEPDKSNLKFLYKYPLTSFS